MSWYVEPELDEVLSDPMVRTVMERDQVDPEHLRVFLQDMGHTLARQARDGEANPSKRR